MSKATTYSDVESPNGQIKCIKPGKGNLTTRKIQKPSFKALHVSYSSIYCLEKLVMKSWV